MAGDDPSTRVDKVIDPVRCERILADLEGISSRTNIHESFILEGMSRWCSEEEVEWVTGLLPALDVGDVTGLAYSGITTRLVDRMQAIGGACIRNFVEARMVTLEDLIDYDHSNVTVLLIPDFYTGELPAWKRTKLLSMLLGRHAVRQATVLYISNVEKMKQDYGETLCQHITETFKPIRGKVCG